MARREDDFSQAVKDELAERAGHRCARQACGRLTIGPSDSDRGSASIGVAAHITAASPGGPRHDPNLTTDARRSPDNGIWLCAACARLVDEVPGRFSVAELRTMKLEHEERVRRERDGDPRDRRRPSERLQDLLEAQAIHEIRKIGFALHDAHWEQAERLLDQLIVFGNTLVYGPDVGLEYLEALRNLTGRFRGVVNGGRVSAGDREAVAGLAWRIQDASQRVEPTGHFKARARQAPSAEEIEVLTLAVEVCSEVAYDGALYVRELRMVEAGAEGLWRVLRFSAINGLEELQKTVECEFETAIDAARRSVGGDFVEAREWLDFRWRDAIADPRGAPVPMPSRPSSTAQLDTGVPTPTAMGAR